MRLRTLALDLFPRPCVAPPTRPSCTGGAQPGKPPRWREVKNEIVAARQRDGRALWAPLQPDEVPLQRLWYVFGACTTCGGLQHLSGGCGQHHRKLVLELQQQLAAAAPAAQAPAVVPPAAAAAAPLMPQQVAADSTDGPCDMED